MCTSSMYPPSPLFLLSVRDSEALHCHLLLNCKSSTQQEKLKTSLLILKNIFLVTWVGTFSFSNCSLWLIWCCWKLFLKIHNLSQSFCLPCSPAVFCVRSEPISDCGSAEFFSLLQPTSAMQQNFLRDEFWWEKAYFHSLPSFSLKSPH